MTLSTHTTVHRQEFPSLHFECKFGSHQKKRPTQKQLAVLDKEWFKRGIAGPQACCYAGAQRQITALNRQGVDPAD